MSMLSAGVHACILLYRMCSAVAEYMQHCTSGIVCHACAACPCKVKWTVNSWPSRGSALGPLCQHMHIHSDMAGRLKECWLAHRAVVLEV